MPTRERLLIRSVDSLDDVLDVDENRCSTKITTLGDGPAELSLHRAALTDRRIHVGLLHKTLGSGPKK